MEKSALLKKGGLPKQDNKSTLSKTPVLCPLHPSFSKFWENLEKYIEREWKMRKRRSKEKEKEKEKEKGYSKQGGAGT